MKLRDFVKQYDPDTVFFVSAYSGFFFIGTAQELQKDAYKIDQSFIKTAQNLVLKHKAGRNLWQATNSKIGAKDPKKYLDEYTMIKDREVLECYPRLSRDGLVVTIDGTETGKFWFRSEYHSEACSKE